MLTPPWLFIQYHSPQQRVCADQLVQVFTDIFNLSLAQATVPTCLKTTTIIPVPKHSSAEFLNDFHPVALNPIVMKCFEKLVLSHLIACLPPHQFAYRPKLSDLGICTSICNWIMDFLTNRPQSVTAVVNNDESAYMEEIQSLSAWCSMNNLNLNATKTKELTATARAPTAVCTPLSTSTGLK
ncbi:hypothetical protein QTP86_017317 [Hemibagrus guttatus]|nr:hypothetical protein QTP86_017317 [Hemibagrus guttatus]